MSPSRQASCQEFSSVYSRAVPCSAEPERGTARVAARATTAFGVVRSFLWKESVRARLGTQALAYLAPSSHVFWFWGVVCVTLCLRHVWWSM